MCTIIIKEVFIKDGAAEKVRREGKQKKKEKKRDRERERERERERRNNHKRTHFPFRLVLLLSCFEDFSF